jgi:HPt (histidine-containing phosphotransfer) domain-containing protein
VWGHQDMTARNVVRVTMSRLRTKIEDDPSHPRLLHTVAGEGFMLRDAAAKPDTPPPPAADAARDEPGPLDLDAIAELRQLGGEGGEDALRQLVAVFEEAAMPRLSALHEALGRRDAGELERRAHTLKGSSLSVGARRVADLSRALEQVGRAGDLTRAADLLPQLETELARYEAAIEAVLDAGPTAKPDGR